ncbi:MAG: GNAT family N-acetyltransferase [Deltaproteobacteria bacterium HGW-Deltaproteobacteria-2]|jgi:predicted N-acetyltransferase YhbS|nr:MAG: GNAT family N-acetyltransferase [Deltaproteobacteria bacterium HGW-Deltaproteobacteria-2]
MPNFKIRTCTQEDTGILTETIRKAFRDVAERFGLTPDNAPRHPSNCTNNWIRYDIERGVIYFVLEIENKVIGCVACEKASSNVCYLERLAVLPEHRQKGIGKALVNHVLSKAGELGANGVSIGIIAEHIELKKWYKKIGFTEGGSRKFLNLPFLVTFMSYKLP